MNDDYLWDRSGDADPEVVRLEELLGRFRHSVARPPRRQARTWLIAAAAIVTLAVGCGLALRFYNRQPGSALTSWQVSIEGREPVSLRTGQIVETSSSQATMTSPQVGQVRLSPDSRLQLLKASQGEQRFALNHGTVHALIWAPPKQFIVDTPSAKVVDLGCQYTLRVDKDGSGALTVETGWVAFEWQHLESFIPAEATCRTRRNQGPGTPYFLDASPELTAALTRFDAHPDAPALTSILSAARKRDALTLWHLLERTEGPDRARVWDRFSSLTAPPARLSRDAILRGDRAALDEAWNLLGLGDMNWWRGWERPWPRHN